jgi:hypothetical protein
LLACLQTAKQKYFKYCTEMEENTMRKWRKKRAPSTGKCTFGVAMKRYLSCIRGICLHYEHM